MQIYLARNNQQAGPYTLEQLNQMLASQQVLLTDLIWHQGMTEWKALGELTHGQFVYQPQGYVPPTQLHQEVQNPSYQNSPIQKVTVNKAASSSELASIGSRILAKVIDLLLWLPAFALPSFFFNHDQQGQLLALQHNLQAADTSNQMTQLQKELFTLIPMEAWAAMALYIFIMLVVQAIMIAKSGQSIGKKLARIKIVDANNNGPVSLFRAFTLRSVLFIFLTALLFPFINIFDFAFGLHKKRQTLHDKLAKTIVIKN